MSLKQKLQNATDSKNSNDKLTSEEYVARARQEIEDWMNPKQNVLTKSLSAISAPIEQAGDAIMNAPQFGDTLKDAVEEALTTLSDTASWSIDNEQVLEEYNQTHTSDKIESIADIQKLPLKTIDEQVKLFKSKYVAAASAQGITTGVVGWAGIAVDIAGLLTANLRAINEYALHYGFDTNKESEQLFAISLLAIATSHSAKERQAALNDTLNLLKDPETMAFNKVNEELMSRVIRQTATQVATNLVKTKAAQVVPAVGAVVAGGVNAKYTATVCDAAYQCYRKRFLDRAAA